MEHTYHRNGKGEIKYYASYQSAWNACIRLNESETRGQWMFEADLNGWYCELYTDNN